MQKFFVTVTRSVCTRLDIKIEAANEQEARQKALNTAGDYDFSDGSKGEPEYTIDWVRPIEAPKQSENKYPIEDWKYEVLNGDTKLGYADWVEHKKESDSDDMET